MTAPADDTWVVYGRLCGSSHLGTTPDGKWLVLRTVDSDWRSRDEFRWRRTVETVAPDWDPDPTRDHSFRLDPMPTAVAPMKRIAAEVVLIVSVSTVAAVTALVLWLRRVDRWFSAPARPNRIL